MKKVINHPDNVVDELLQGMVYAHPNHVRRLLSLSLEENIKPETN